MKIALIVLAMGLLLSGCSGSQQWPPGPAVVHLGEETCAACKMIISEERYGAQLHERGKPVEHFDDYGCLLTRKTAKDSGTRMTYVRSAETGDWLREDQALFVVSKKISSPMGYGIAAFGSRESAAEFARGFDDSKVYTVSELIPGAEKILRGVAYKKE